MLANLPTVFKSLNSHEVKYLVIGGVAAASHGSPRATFDLDILIEATIDNATRLLSALLEAGLGTASLITAEKLLSKEITIFKDIVKVDVQTVTPGIEFSSAWRRRETSDIDGQQFPILSVEDLLAAKTASGRPKDLEDIQAIRAIHDKPKN